MNIQSNDLNKVWEELNTPPHHLEYFPPLPSSSNTSQELLGPFFVISAEQSIPLEQRATTANFTPSEESDISVNSLVHFIKQKLNDLNGCISSDEHIYSPDDYSFVQRNTENITSLINQILAQLNIQG